MDYKEKVIALLNSQELSKEQKEMLETIFPELKESEDEQHRKWILEYLYDGFRKSDEQFKDQFKCAIAWLEKQVSVDEEKVLIGARKDVALSIMNFLDRNTLGMCLSNMECADLESAVVDSDWSKVYNYMKKKLEKQSEQKSIKTCAEYYNKDRELKMPVLSEFQDKLADILMHREYDGPDETEDDIAKGRLEYELAAIRLSEELLPLAQKEQKPAAWSEEDKTYLDHIITAIKSYYTDDKGKENPWREELLGWLESLKERYNWKPSDEQLKAIEFMVRSFGESGTLSPYGETMAYATSLLNDLKKLKA